MLLVFNYYYWSLFMSDTEGKKEMVFSGCKMYRLITEDSDFNIEVNRLPCWK